MAPCSPRNQIPVRGRLDECPDGLQLGRLGLRLELVRPKIGQVQAQGEEEGRIPRRGSDVG
jgi:hypothetical protein